MYYFYLHFLSAIHYLYNIHFFLKMTSSFSLPPIALSHHPYILILVFFQYFIYFNGTLDFFMKMTISSSIYMNLRNFALLPTFLCIYLYHIFKDSIFFSSYSIFSHFSSFFSSNYLSSSFYSSTLCPSSFSTSSSNLLSCTFSSTSLFILLSYILLLYAFFFFLPSPFLRTSHSYFLFQSTASSFSW